jgi:hypothetical protein
VQGGVTGTKLIFGRKPSFLRERIGNIYCAQLTPEKSVKDFIRFT